MNSSFDIVGANHQMSAGTSMDAGTTDTVVVERRLAEQRALTIPNSSGSKGIL
jgi:hypothetical protein